MMEDEWMPLSPLFPVVAAVRFEASFIESDTCNQAVSFPKTYNALES